MCNWPICENKMRINKAWFKLSMLMAQIYSDTLRWNLFYTNCPWPTFSFGHFQMTEFANIASSLRRQENDQGKWTVDTIWLAEQASIRCKNNQNSTMNCLMLEGFQRRSRHESHVLKVMCNLCCEPCQWLASVALAQSLYLLSFVCSIGIAL